MATTALRHAAASQLVVNDGDGFAFRHALTCEVILAGLTPPDMCRLALAAADALTATGLGTGAEASGRAMLLGRLLVDGGQPARAAEELLRAGHRAFAAGDFASAELLLREADRIVGLSQSPADLRIAVAGEFAQVILQAGQPAEAAGVAVRTVAAADGLDPAAATAMRLVLARAAAMTARWDDARAQLADIRRGGVADPATAAELALVDAQVALGDGRAGSRAEAEHLAAAASASLPRPAGRSWSARRWKRWDRAPASAISTPPPLPTAAPLTRPGACPFTGCGSSTSSGRWKCSAMPEVIVWNRPVPRRSGPAPWAWPPASVPTWPHCGP